MMLFVNLFQPFVVNVRVDLSCRYVLMAEHHLNGPQISAALEQMGCKGVPHGMRRDIASAKGGGIFLYDLEDRLP